MTKNISIYIHIPFCVSKCAYCDFYSLPCGKSGKIAEKKAYTDALIRNIKSTNSENLCVKTIFIGGGTPTSLETEQLCEIISALHEHFEISPDAEFTVESNPATFDTEKLKALRALGVNRLSMGMQSANDSELRLLSRIHSRADAVEAFRLARNAGFDNINLDLMYAIPSQTLGSFEKTLDEVIALRPEHLSVYGLQIEDGTPFGKNRDKYDFPNDDAETALNSLAVSKLETAGYHRYEISNYSLPGKECAHNLVYWSQGEYIGFGTGAHSFINGCRISTPKDIALYTSCNDFNSITVTEEILDNDAMNDEFIMLSLRLTKGVSLSALNARGYKTDELIKKAAPFIQNGFMTFNGKNLSFTSKGFNVSNYILSELIY